MSAEINKSVCLNVVFFLGDSKGTLGKNSLFLLLLSASLNDCPTISPASFPA
jgi:hypothetical protein